MHSSGILPYSATTYLNYMKGFMKLFADCCQKQNETEQNFGLNSN